MHKEEKKFYEVFTDLQCLILANMNRGDIHGVTATHYNIIEYVYRHEKCTGKEIAKAFNISPPAVSRQLKFLIANDFVVQQQSPLDRRIFYLNISDKGKLIVDNSENFREKVAKRVSDTLTQEELKTLTALLNKVVEEINR